MVVFFLNKKNKHTNLQNPMIKMLSSQVILE